jgi:hypothetical protein
VAIKQSKSEATNQVRSRQTFDNERYRTHNATESSHAPRETELAGHSSNTPHANRDSAQHLGGGAISKGDSFDGLLELMDNEIEGQHGSKPKHHQQHGNTQAETAIESLDNAADLNEASTTTRSSYKTYGTMSHQPHYHRESGSGGTAGTGVGIYGAASTSKSDQYSSSPTKYGGQSSVTAAAGGAMMGMSSTTTSNTAVINSSSSRTDNTKGHARGARGLASPGLASAFFANDTSLSHAMSSSPSHSPGFGTYGNSSNSGATASASSNKYTANTPAFNGPTSGTGTSDFGFPLSGTSSHYAGAAKGMDNNNNRRIGGAKATLDGLDEDLMDLILADG